MPGSQTDDRAPARKTKTFTQFLLDLRKGRLHSELTDKLEEVVANCVQHGKAGSLTVTFKFKTTGDGVLSVIDQYAAKIPTPPADPSIFFADDSGQLSRDRLNQDRLPFTDIGGGKTAQEAS